MWFPTDLEQYEYGIIINNLKSNSTVKKLKALNELLSYQIIDTKQGSWQNLCAGLQQCFLNSNKDVFICALKVHYRIIHFSDTACHGYSSLLKGTILLLNNNSDPDNFCYKIKLFQTLKLILSAHITVIRLLLYNVHQNLVDEIITEFVKLLSFEDSRRFIKIIDPEAKWFRNFSFGVYIRCTFFKILHEIEPDFYKSAIKDVVHSNSDIITNNYELINLLFYFLSHEDNRKYFPLKLDDEDEIKFEHLLELIVIKREMFNKTQFVVTLFDENPQLMSGKLLNILLESVFSTQSVAVNQEVFQIINNIAKSSNCKVLFDGTLKLNNKTRSKHINNTITVNIPQKIIELTITLLKSNENKENDLKIILTACKNIYLCHPVALTYTNPIKFLTELKNFYIKDQKNICRDLKMQILALFNYFYSFYGNATKKIAGCDNEILHDLFSFYPVEDLTVINSISENKFGFEFIKNRYNQIMKPYLEEIWTLIESEDCPNNETIYEKFVTFLFSLKLQCRSVVAFLSYDCETSTLVGTDDEKNVDFGDLIEKSINKSGNDEEEFLGLLIIKVCMSNLDLLLYLQTNYQIQEKLFNLQQESQIIDPQSSVRKSILNHFYLGSNFDFHLINNEFETFLNKNEKLADNGWILHVRRVFKTSVGKINPLILFDVLEKIPKIYTYRKVELIWPPPDSVYYQLHPEDLLGISTIIRYGHKLGILEEKPETAHCDNLALLIKQSRVFLNHQPEDFTNFDWFVGLMFIITSGNVEKTKRLLINFTQTGVTSLLWATFGKNFDESILDNFYLNLEIILEENTVSYQALKMIGISSSNLVQFWINQCFLNYLNFEEIINLLIFSLLHPPECLLYYMVAIFKHLEDKITTVTYSSSLDHVFDMIHMGEFKLSNHLNFLEKLTKEYRNTHKLL